MTRRLTLDTDLVDILREEFGDEAPVLELFEDFLGPGGYTAALSARLVRLAGARGCAPSWALRRAACSMLESQLLALSAEDPGEFERVVLSIVDGTSSALDRPTVRSTSPDQRSFVDGIRARIARMARVYRRLNGRETSPQALRDFLATARQECKLTLARYFFRPDEVARRVLEQVRTSRGLAAPFESTLLEEEAERCVGEWPAYEREILMGLLAGSRVLWAGEATSSRLNALVEYPLGTVVLVVKPPGSHLEIEIKRAGRRGDHPLSVVFERDDAVVPSSHRLDGGSMGPSLKTEAGSAAVVGRIYRLIHGRRAPISQTLAHRSIHEVPCPGGRAHVLDYFTKAEVFGSGFLAMREAMTRSIPAFAREWGTEPLQLPGNLGVTATFLNLVNPLQAFLGQTSSFRLDLLASYLSDEGPELYFRRGLGVPTSPDDSRRFAETLLDETLGEWRPVDVEHRDQGGFVDAVLAVPANRRRADEVFHELTIEIGRFWGTLFGLKIQSAGESFVGRNVGLKSAWDEGAWRVRIVFMDHDGLTVPRGRFPSLEEIRRCYHDAAYVLGTPPFGRESELDLLADIYRVDSATRARGRSGLLAAAREARRQAQECLARDPEVGSFFHAEYPKSLLDWEDSTTEYLVARGRGHDRPSSLSAAAGLLGSRGHPEEVVRSFTAIVERTAVHLERFAILYDVEPCRAS
jgi:hypothetical protein